MPVASLTERLAEGLDIRAAQADATLVLLKQGATVPFVARYRKEATGGLDDAQLRALDAERERLEELDARRETVLRQIEQQGQLDDALRAEIEAAGTRTRLEDLYRPYRPRRRTKAQIAREAGLEPLADSILADRTQPPTALAAHHYNTAHGIETAEAALDGARQILMERLAEDATVRERLRGRASETGRLRSALREGKDQAGANYSDYFAHEEPIASVPSHRALAMFRGEKAEVLALDVYWPEAGDGDPPWALGTLGAAIELEDQGRPGDTWLAETVRRTWRVRLGGQVVSELKRSLREAAETAASEVFAENLRDVLMASPAGARAVMGIDPGLRTGIKVAVLDATGRPLDTATLHPFPPKADPAGTQRALADLARRHAVELVAVGNGTASRETAALVDALIRDESALTLTRVLVSESGASVYSASELASRELPDMDVSLRGAVSIARRLQDPMAELVKITPRSIGVGQYQHDIGATRLDRALDAVVEDCVNAVGVEVNQASASLLARVAGLGTSLAENIVAHRDARGAFQNRAELREVPRLGPRAFEQCAGFLRIRAGRNPLDTSAVHPEAYTVVERIAAHTGHSVAQLIGNARVLGELEPKTFVDERFGEPTVRDIVAELEKPGRDPRPEFRTASFRDDVHALTDLEPGMHLEGTVTNVAAFGAFVDIGVHQDGLVHVSQLADRFVKDPRSVVRAGDVVSVRVLDVDPDRRRIGLSMRSEDGASTRAKGDERKPDAQPAQPPASQANAQGASRQRGGDKRKGGADKKKRGQRTGGQDKREPSRGTLGDALADAMKDRNGRP